ncbi:MAG TPA: DUF4142 domain-containing protein [Bryobacteraceae bacterium]|nr:DUF4142 domain-containing protein [Bryobacteraceae bacterium]
MRSVFIRAAGLTGFAAALALSGAARAQSDKSALNSADSKFVAEAAQGGMAEVELGRLAAQKAQSDDVKKFGQRMVDDHTKANDQLKQIAAQKDVTLPSDVGSRNRAAIDRLSKLSGADFDRAYMRLMVRDHRKDVSEFQKEANNGKDADVKNFASSTLPTLQDHLKEAERIAGEAGAHSADRRKTTSGPATETKK